MNKELQHIFDVVLLDILVDDIKVIARNAKSEIEWKQYQMNMEQMLQVKNCCIQENYCFKEVTDV